MDSQQLPKYPKTIPEALFLLTTWQKSMGAFGNQALQTTRRQVISDFSDLVTELFENAAWKGLLTNGYFGSTCNSADGIHLYVPSSAFLIVAVLLGSAWSVSMARFGSAGSFLVV